MESKRFDGDDGDDSDGDDSDGDESDSDESNSGESKSGERRRDADDSFYWFQRDSEIKTNLEDNI